ncbi:FACT complex subunit Ssrp1 [Macrosteles quadrilineatus]|uniref:FACT complex subunit Ssrp1 n=1 Tax=Macrosteles quadrilineatus TaxID=74068 RepID=UPI0023E2AD62|nr:FACT complex subunit Ssrp1 [Macrosteles quadrilineatus]
MGELEFSEISAETKGSLTPGKLKLSDQAISFKNSKTGKVEQILASDLEFVNWQKLVGQWGLRLFLKNGSLHRFFGFRESEQDKIAKFFKTSYSLDMLEKELSVKGWNWGTAKFAGSVLSFEVGNLSAFEVPLNNVSQCTTGKNEVTIEFHQNDDAPVGLMEMRFHIPVSELAGDDPVEAFHKQVMDQASVISVSGDAIAIFREIQCLTPRGRYDIKVFNTFFQLHGKTFDYKIPMSTVLRLFALPHKDGRQNFFVVSLDPPIKQGQTRYHFLVFLFGQDDETSIELPFSEDELKEKYEDKLSKELSGPTWEVLGKVMRAIVNRKITTPGGFIGHTGTPAIGCSYKAAAGFLYPLERGFIFIHKPPIHIRFEEISSVNFARSGGSTRSFDFEVELKSTVVHTFSSIEKEEYTKLFDFIASKKLRVKNRGKNDKPSYADDFGDSDQEGAPDAYLARVKREAEERDEDDGGSEEDESTDEDFNPNLAESDVAEEFDSNPEPTDSDDDSEASGGSGDNKEKKKKKEKKEKKSKSAKTISEKPRKPRKNKKEKDANAPKRPPTAFMCFLNENREKIKRDNPGIAFLDISKKAGEMWKTLENKKEYEDKVAKLKEEYQEAMKEYKATGGGATSSPSESKKSSKKPKSSPRKSSASAGDMGSGTKYISKEFIESDSSDSDSDKKSKKNGSKPAAKSKEKSDSSSGEDDESEEEKEVKKEEKKDKSKKTESEDDEIDEPEESTPPTSENESGGDSDSD